MITEVESPSKITVSDREVRIVRAYADGVSAREIAQQECISVRTVESIIGKLRYKFECRTTTQLVAKFIREKIID